MIKDWSMPGHQLVARVLRSLPLPAGKWRLANAVADLFAKDGVSNRELARLATGFAMQLDLGDVMQRRMYFSGEYDPRASRLFRQVLQPGDTVVDGGANIGYFSLLAASRVGETGAVHAFEPMPHTFELLRNNILLNRYTSVVANQAALSDRPGMLAFHIPAQANIGTATSVVPAIGPSVRVPALPLDDYADRNQLTSIALAKLDIEGSELNAIHGMQRLLSEHRISYLVCEVNPPLLDVQRIPVDALRQALTAHGYRCYRIGLLARLRLVDGSLPRREADYLFVAPRLQLPDDGGLASIGRRRGSWAS